MRDLHLVETQGDSPSDGAVVVLNEPKARWWSRQTYRARVLCLQSEPPAEVAVICGARSIEEANQIGERLLEEHFSDGLHYGQGEEPIVPETDTEWVVDVFSPETGKWVWVLERRSDFMDGYVAVNRATHHFGDRETAFQAAVNARNEIVRVESTHERIPIIDPEPERKL